MRCYFLFIFLFFCMPLFGQYQGIPMTGSNIKPTQIRWTRDIGTDSIFIMATDTTTGKPFWLSAKKSSLLSGGGSTNTDGQTLSLLAGGGTLKLTQLAGASNFVQLKDSSISNEGKLTLTPPSGGVAYINSNTSTSASVGIKQGNGITLSNGGTNIVTITNSKPNTDGQTLSLLAGGGTLKLTQLAGASNFVQLKDSTITNEGELSVSAGTASTSIITSNTSGSSAVTLKAGSGVTLSETVDTITITNSKPNTDEQALSLLAGGGTLKLTKTGAASDFVQLKDSTITNEGELSVSAGTASTSIITSNTSGSSAVTLKAGSGVTLSETVDTITITSTATATIKEALKSDRLGIIVVSDSIGYDYKKLVKEEYPDSLDLVAMFDSSANRNKKINLKYLDYDPYGGANSISDFTLSLVAGVDSILKLESDILYLFTYSQTTGEMQYTGGSTLIFKIDAGIDFTAGSITPYAFTFSLSQKKAGTYSVIAESYARSHYSKSTNLAVMNMNTSRIVQVDPGDKFKISLKADANNTATIRSGFMNIHFISRHIQY